MCDLKSPHAQSRYAVGKIKPPIAGDLGTSHSSHMQDATGTRKSLHFVRKDMSAVTVSDQCACYSG